MGLKAVGLEPVKRGLAQHGHGIPAALGPWLSVEDHMNRGHGRQAKFKLRPIAAAERDGRCVVGIRRSGVVGRGIDNVEAAVHDCRDGRKILDIHGRRVHGIPRCSGCGEEVGSRIEWHEFENLPPVPTVVDRGLDVVYPTTYYSGATDSDDATPIALRGGDRPELELRLSPVPSIHVIFHTQPGTEGGGYPMPVLRKSAFDGFEPNRLQPHIQAISPNAFELITAPGKYSVELHRPTENAQNVRIKEIDLTQNHQVID